MATLPSSSRRPGRSTRIATLALLLVAASGCRHGLEIHREGEWATPYYRRDAPLDESVPVTLGLLEGPPGEIERAILGRLEDEFVGTSAAFGSGGGRILVDVSLAVDFLGDGKNFFIAWPGFFIFTPAWRGFQHHLVFEFVATYHIDGRSPHRSSITCGYLTRSCTFGQAFWTTGLGWFSLATGGLGAAAFVAAPWQIPFRDAITPFVLEVARGDIPDIVDYVSRKIREDAARLARSG